MNGIILGVLGLITGLFSGGLLFNDDDNQRGQQEMSVASDERIEIIGDDYVSMRPQVMQLAKEDLSTAEKDGLIFMREEEKLARDVYQTLYEQWNKPVFSNIAQSEQTHTEAIRQLLEKYNIEDPVRDDTVGVFTNPDFAKLYKDLVAQGKQSEEEALKVGALIEDLDIKDLNDRITQTDNADIKAVYENLLRGSRNHLRAFTKQLNNSGVDYESKYISTEELDTITSGTQERGNGNGWGGGGMQGGGRRGGM